MAHLWFETALLPQGWADRVRVTIEGERIATIETGVEAEGAERYGAALPGLGNIHSHAFQRAMAGLGEVRGSSDDSFWTWREVMYRFASRIGPEAMEAIAAMAFAEMLESGFTRVGEFHYLHHQPGGQRYDNPAEMAARIAASAAGTGIGLTLLPVLYMQGGFGGSPTSPAQRRFVSDLDGYAALHAASIAAVKDMPDAIVGVAPHSLRAVAPAALAAVIQLGDGPIHIHIAEQQREVEDCLAWSGARPVEWLFDHAAVDPRWCLVHATHMTDEETRRLAESGAVAGLCPLTEASLGDGIFNGRDYRAAGGRFGIGSDSNILIDAGQELAALEVLAGLGLRVRALDRAAVVDLEHRDVAADVTAVRARRLCGGRGAPQDDDGDDRGSHLCWYGLAGSSPLGRDGTCVEPEPAAGCFGCAVGWRSLTSLILIVFSSSGSSSGSKVATPST